ncbi:hypothetical protein C8F04DRAFT_1288901 [Mycena alexandri]|uniref:Uncharacterized protein n=1 Tax=Mycena alexandri TaxID=1745969 RepID=A0AAD6WXQ1_9AGAR|nr:hypothetical protein C8F04DRAFT_1288901 [Mycena alexandri]
MRRMRAFHSGRADGMSERQPRADLREGEGRVKEAKDAGKSRRNKGGHRADGEGGMMGWNVCLAGLTKIGGEQAADLNEDVEREGTGEEERRWQTTDDRVEFGQSASAGEARSVRAGRKLRRGVSLSERRQRGEVTPTARELGRAVRFTSSVGWLRGVIVLATSSKRSRMLPPSKNMATEGTRRDPQSERASGGGVVPRMITKGVSGLKEARELRAWRKARCIVTRPNDGNELQKKKKKSGTGMAERTAREERRRYELMSASR